MPRELRHHIAECALHRLLRSRGCPLHRHLPRGQTQVERRRRALAVFQVHNSMEMHEVGLVGLKSALKFFKLGLEFVLDGGRFAGFIADMNVHARLGVKIFSKEAPKAPLSWILHPRAREEKFSNWVIL